MAVLRIAANRIVMDIWVLGMNRTAVKVWVINIVGDKVMHLKDKTVYEVVIVA
jgi:hypothetical protein